MKESVLDVLMYLFEHYLDEDTDVDSDRDSLKEALADVGFPQAEISKAFEWLESLTADDDPALPAQAGASTRVRLYTDAEMERLDVRCRGFLLFLEQVGVLDSATRELVIDRVMALEADDIDLDQLKWVVLMVLFNLPGRESVYSWMEEFVFERADGRMH